MFVTITFAAILIIVLTCEYYNLKTGVPTHASFRSAQNKIIDILRKDSETRTEARPYVIIDLGSGSGQMTARIARAIPESRVIGIELSFFPWLWSILWQRLSGLKNLEYKRIDFWSYDCAEAHAIVTYMTENVMERISHKLRNELKPGTLIVANDAWLSSGWQPVAVQDNDIFGRFSSKIYIYRQ